MSDLVKTGNEIHRKVASDFGRLGGYEAITNGKSALFDNYLILPSGLDEIERLCKKDLCEHEFEVVREVLDDFKKRHGIV